MLQIYSNIKTRRKQLGYTQTELAKKLGYADKSMIAKIEKGQVDLSQSKIMAFAKALETTASALMGDDGIVTTDAMIYGDEQATPLPKSSISIPLYTSISCGTGLFVDDQVEDYIAVPDKYIKKGHEYFANTASGDSMIGKGIKNGDVLVFEKTNIVENGQIGVFCVGESEAVCKTFRKLPNGLIMLESANEKYDPIIVDLTDECFRVIGKYKFKFSVEQ